MRERLKYTESNEDISSMYSSGHLDEITPNDLATILKVGTVATALRWLEKNGIQIHKRCKKNIACKFEVDVAIDKQFVKGLMKKYPSNWEEKYQLVAKDIKVCQLVIEELKGESWKSPTTIVKPLNESDNKLIKKLKS